MTPNARWMRTLRTIVVAGLLVIALLGAVLGSIGTRGWNWAHSPGETTTTPPLVPSGMTFRIGAAPDVRRLTAA